MPKSGVERGENYQYRNRAAITLLEVGHDLDFSILSGFRFEFYISSLHDRFCGCWSNVCRKAKGFPIGEGNGRASAGQYVGTERLLCHCITGRVIIRGHHGFFCTNSVLTCVAQYNKAVGHVQ